ncbi:NADP-dependent phosphogluconate dehydrogenase [Azospirillum sp. SYSU D00513]|uniref:NADP-dependent phosphogluconate dehydrogenase n=1 Tax=Azospirillum sp. SYSU D00513 TaxID=2812561 RepID=UPI001FFE970F|nr:NADP-dependent phosphogluconate dehydrogenase [Azospirillum sp. SYSU D00513]
MIVVVMGVSGSGKSTVGQMLAEGWGCAFSDADSFHPASNVEKMSRGVPLTDEDRIPWLRAIRAAMEESLAAGRDHVFACSALKREYRHILAPDGTATGEVVFAHLSGSAELIRERLGARSGHFFDPALLQSQFDTLEAPDDAILVDIRRSPEDIVADLTRVLRPDSTIEEDRGMTVAGGATMGLVGLGVMGRNLAANLADHGVTVAGYDLGAEQRAAFAAAVPNGVTCGTLSEMLEKLPTPRLILMMVPAGAPVDALLASLLPVLSRGDVVIDGGNSHYRDTQARVRRAANMGVEFIGLGVSGGEEGARRGPSLMAGGTEEAVGRVAPLLRAIAARAPDGEPCFARVGPDGAGHFVKMIHNGIEYADMQLISEGYHLLRNLCGFSYEKLAETFSAWNEGELASYLMEITTAILGKADPETGAPILEIIRDAAGQKGTGHWASTTAMELGMPAPTIAEAVFARSLSALKEERVAAAAALPVAPPAALSDTEAEALAAAIGDALLAARIAVYAQGFAVIAAGSREFGWNIDMAAVSSIWRGGCIIRARVLERILTALRRTPDLPNLMLDEELSGLVRQGEAGWRRAIGAAVAAGVPVPAMGSALAYWDGYRTGRLWANMIQAQRDFFGAHGYERLDRPGKTHTDWS